VLCNTWNRSDDNDTISGIAILDSRYYRDTGNALRNFNVFQKSPVSYSSITEICVSSSISTVYSEKAIAFCVCCMKYAPSSVNITRIQAVAMIANHTSSQHFWGSHHVIGHVTIWYVISYWWSFGLTKTLYVGLTVSEMFNVECNGWHDLDTTSKQ